MRGGRRSGCHAAPAPCALPAGVDRHAGAALVLRLVAGQAQRCGARAGRLGGAFGAVVVLVELEGADHVFQRAGLFLQRGGGGGRFLDQRRVLLRHLVHRGDGLVDLVDARTLLLAGGHDLGHDVGDARHAADDLLHRRTSLVDQLRAGLDALDRGADQLLDFLGGGGRTLRQVAHLGGDDGEAASLFAGTRRLDGRVQRQDIGLEGDAVDDGNNVDDALGRAVDGAHGVDHLGHQRAALEATDEALKASWLAWRALSAFCRTVEVISSSEEAVSSRLPAWCSVRRDRSRLPAAICSLAVAIELLPSRTPRTVADSLSCILARPVSRRPISSSRSATIEFDRLPPAMASKWSSAWASGPMMARSSATLEARISTAPTTTAASAQSNSLSYSAWLAS